MEKMIKPTEEQASTLEAFRLFDQEGTGIIDTRLIRDVIMKSLDQIPSYEIEDLLECTGLIQEKDLSYEGTRS